MMLPRQISGFGRFSYVYVRHLVDTETLFVMTSDIDVFFFFYQSRIRIFPNVSVPIPISSDELTCICIVMSCIRSLVSNKLFR